MIKKILLITVSIIVVLILSLAGILFFEYKDIKPPVNGVVLNDKVITIKDGISNIFLIQTAGKNAILVDAGMTKGAAPILNTLSEHGMNADSVKAIFLTHGHFDHIAGCPIFKNARIFAMKEDAAIIEGKESMGLMTNDGSVRVTDPLKDKDRVKIEGVQIEAFAVPGHSKGCAAYLIDGVLFMGDSANAQNDNKLKHAVWFLSEDMKLNESSLKKLAELLKPRAGEIKAIAFSHTGHLDGLSPLLEFTEKN